MNKQEIIELLESRGMGKLVTTKKLAGILNLNVRVITNAKNRGELVQLDRNTYDMTSVTKWLSANPRYIARIL